MVMAVRVAMGRWAVAGNVGVPDGCEGVGAVPQYGVDWFSMLVNFSRRGGSAALPPTGTYHLPGQAVRRADERIWG